MKIPWRARLPWFVVWVPAALLLYILVNGAGHMRVAYIVLHTGPSPEAAVALRVATFLCSPWGFPLILSLIIFAYVSWRLCPQWSPLVRWMSGMLGLLFGIYCLLAYAALICPLGWREGKPSARDLRVCTIQLWKPHLCRPILEPFDEDGPAWKAQASDIATLLKDKDSSVRYVAILTLYNMGAREYAPNIAALLKDEDADVRRWAADILGSMRVREYVPVIATLLKDENARVRGMAAEALSRIGAREFTPNIVDLLKDPQPDARASAASAIGSLTGQNFSENEAGVLAAQTWWAQHKDDPPQKAAR